VDNSDMKDDAVNNQTEVKTAAPEPTLNKLEFKNPKVPTGKMGLFLSLSIAMFICLTVFGYYVMNHDFNFVNPFENQQAIKTVIYKKPVVDEKKVSNENVPVGNSELALDETINLTYKETWLKDKVELPDQDYFASSFIKNMGTVHYYKIGTRVTNDIIMAAVFNTRWFDLYLFEKKPDNTVVAICAPASVAMYAPVSSADVTNDGAVRSCTGNLKSTLKYTLGVHYRSLIYPSNFTLEPQGLVFSGATGIGYLYDTPKDGIVETEVQQIVGQGTVYRRESTNTATNLTMMSYFIKTPINTVIELTYEPLDLNLAKYRWTSGSKSVADSIHGLSRGCNLNMSVVARGNSITMDDVQQVGLSGDDLVVYEFKNINHPLMKKAYDDYISSSRSSYPLSIDSFAEEHAVILYKDINGQWLVYSRDKYDPQLGC
jgi:hypothetical protein